VCLCVCVCETHEVCMLFIHTEGNDVHYEIEGVRHHFQINSQWDF